MNARLEAEAHSHAVRMDGIYRSQRHIYDITRAYYLLGRDGLLDALDLKPGQKVLEIGCGTGRNLLGVAQRYPRAQLFGLDISGEMLLSAEASLKRAGRAQDVQLAMADATAFDAAALFDVAQFDRVYFSYTLSMIPVWQAALRQALRVVAPGGALHIVDFGSCERLPGFFKAGLYAWLAKFQVSPRQDLEHELHDLLGASGGQMTLERPFGGYAVRAKISKLP
jgi:S-adenosylmethionine-diacylgycerolhomoserine-N-methlytransferase